MNQFIITGTTNGIGKSINEILLENKNNIILGISKSHKDSSENYTHMTVDLSDLSRVKSIEMPDLDKNCENVVLVNNAGVLGDIKKIGDGNIEHIDKVINVNYTAPMILTELFVKKYQNHKIKKSIINISSGASSSPYASWSNYCSSKAALEMYSMVLNVEQEFYDYPINCFSIAPGVVDTNMQLQIRNTDKKDFDKLDKFIDLYESGNLYSTDQVAEEIVKVSLMPEKYKEKIFRVALV